jgi:hypothetical protein
MLFFSRYPSVCLKAQFVKGQPITLVGKRLDMVKLIDGKFYLQTPTPITKTKIEGVMHVKIMVPRQNNLKGIPFLLSRMGGRSMGAECRTCMDKSNKKMCNCDDDKRAFIDTYSVGKNIERNFGLCCTNCFLIVEVEYAIKLGYILMEIYECYVSMF